MSRASLFALLLVGLAVASLPTGSPAQEGTGGPIGRWRFAAREIDGATVRALAGKLPATIRGPVKLDPGPPECLVLDGRANRVLVTDDLARADLPAEEMTAEAWVLLETATEWGGIVGAIQDNGSFEKGWVLGSRKDRFCFGLSTAGADDGNGRLTYLTADSSFALGSWYCVAGTYDGEVQRIYVDGRLAGESRAQSGAINYPAKTWYTIGAYHDDNELYPAKDRIAEVSVFRRAMGPEEIAARFKARKAEFPGIEPTAPEVAGWPTYMHDNARLGWTAEAVELPLGLSWVYRARHAPQPAWPPPAENDFWHNKHNLRARVVYDRAFHVVAAEGRVYFGSSADDQVRCLDLTTGRELWSFFTEGPVRLAPAIHEGRIYFGSDDGWVYCLDAAEGKLLWKHRAAPGDRRIPGSGRLISAWPLRSGTLVAGGRVRLAAGLFPLEGVFQLTLDAATGKELARAELPFSPQGYIEERGGKLFVSQGRAPERLLAELPHRGKTPPRPASPAIDGETLAVIGAGEVRFAGGDGTVAAIGADGRVLWKAEVDGRAYGLAVASGRLLVSTDRGVIYGFAPRAGPSPEPPAKVTSIEFQAAPFPYPNEQTREAYAKAARHIVETTGVTRGYCLVLGSGRGGLVHELAARSELQVIGVEEDAELVAGSRRALDEAGVYGRAVIIHAPIDRLPLGDCLVNLVVSDRWMTAGRPAGNATELLRVLRPEGGTAYLGRPDEFVAAAELDPNALDRWIDDSGSGEWEVSHEGGLWAKLRRGPLAGAGQWTHMYADPGNTASSGDQRVAGKLAIQWFGRPGPRQMIDRHHRTAAPLYAAGRLFIPGNNHVFAVDAYNGTPLWDLDVPDSRRIGIFRDCSYLAAAADTLYVAAGNRCLALGATTGRPARSLRVPPAADGKPREWGYVAVVDDRLFASGVKPGASRREHSRAAVVEGTYWDFRPIVTSDFLFCLDRREGKLLWKYDGGTAAILNPTIALGGGRMYFVRSTNAVTKRTPNGRATLADLLGDGAELVALDAASGKILWKKPLESEARHHLYLSYAREFVVLVGSRNGTATEGAQATVWYDTQAVDAATGRPLWFRSQDNRNRPGGDHGEQDHHPVIAGRTVVVEPYAYDLLSGEPLAGWRLARGGHGCGTLSASARMLFFRAGNPAMCELAAPTPSKVNLVSRPGCWINMIPAGGLLLIPEASSGCTCNFPLQGSMAFFPAGPE